jgi:hypothetical protein
MKIKRIIIALLIILVVMSSISFYYGTPYAVLRLSYYVCKIVLLGNNNCGYLYASSIENSIMSAKSKIEIENILGDKIKKRNVDVSESGWGSHYSLKSDEYMIQYMIKDTEPLEVVYDTQGLVKAVFTSYE